MAHSVGFRCYMKKLGKHKMEIPSHSDLKVRTDITDHVQGIIVAVIEDIIVLNKPRYLEAVVDETDIVGILRAGALKDHGQEQPFEQSLNVISFCLILALQYQSKKCVRFFVRFWIDHVGHSLDASNHRIFESYCSLIRDCQIKETYVFIMWISMVIEPSILSIAPFSRDGNAKRFFKKGREIRYKSIQYALTKHLESMDLIQVILNMDGFGKGTVA